MKIKYLLIFLTIFPLMLISCKGKKSNRPDDTPTSGTVTIGVDETFGPIISEEIQVFQSIYSTTRVNEIRCPEIVAFNLLLKDSVRMIVAARTLKKGESEYFKEQKVFPKEVKIASDGIAFIVHKENQDTLLTTKRIRDILLGKMHSWNEINPGSKLGKIKVVFDNPLSSTAEYAVSEICGGEKLSDSLSALNSNPAVIDFVSKNPEALGVIGVNWISNRKDTTCMGFLEKIRVVAISREEKATAENSYQPYQAYLAGGQYPYTRSVYIILADPRFGLTSGFTSFITSDRGQRIILKSGILPVTQPLRIIHVNEN